MEMETEQVNGGRGTGHNKTVIIVLLGSSLGTFLEFYSFALIGYFQEQVSNAFFPSTSDPTISLLQSFTLFGTALVSRPIGGLFFGYFADKYGRINALQFSILLMAFPTFLIGCTPSYSMIGYWSTIIVFILRFIQGFAAGGEMSSAIVYVMEEAPTNRKGLYIAILWVLGMGELLALLAYKLLIVTMPGETFNLWGFRIPFWASIFISILAVYARYLLPHTPEFMMMTDNAMILPNPLKYAFKNNLKEIVIVSIAQIAPSLLYQISIQWIAAYLLSVKQDDYAYDTAIFVYLVFIPTTVLYGWLCDKYSAYLVCVYGVSFGLILVIIALSWMGITDNPTTLIVIQLMDAFGASFLIAMVIWSALFLQDPRTRTTVLGFTYNLGSALVVSYSFDVCTALESSNHTFGGVYVALYIAMIVLIGLGAICFGHKHPYRYKQNYDIVSSEDNDKLMAEELN